MTRTAQEEADHLRAREWREAHTDYSSQGVFGPDSGDIADLIETVRKETVEACAQVADKWIGRTYERLAAEIRGLAAAPEPSADKETK